MLDSLARDRALHAGDRVEHRLGPSFPFRAPGARSYLPPAGSSIPTTGSAAMSQAAFVRPGKGHAGF
jgi:hypothetical protein